MSKKNYLLLLFICMASFWGLESVRAMNYQTNINSANTFNLVNILDETDDEDLSVSVDGDCSFISEALQKRIQMIIGIIQIGGSVLVVILGITDFTKAVISEDADLKKNATKNFTKRLIALAILLLVPALVNFILTLTGIFSSGADTTCGLAMLLIRGL